MTETYSERGQTSKIEHFAKLVDGSILDVWKGPKYASGLWVREIYGAEQGISFHLVVSPSLIDSIPKFILKYNIRVTKYLSNFPNNICDF